MYIKTPEGLPNLWYIGKPSLRTRLQLRRGIDQCHEYSGVLRASMQMITRYLAWFMVVIFSLAYVPLWWFVVACLLGASACVIRQMFFCGDGQRSYIDYLCEEGRVVIDTSPQFRMFVTVTAKGRHKQYIDGVLQHFFEYSEQYTRHDGMIADDNWFLLDRQDVRDSWMDLKQTFLAMPGIDLNVSSKKITSVVEEVRQSEVERFEQATYRFMAIMMPSDMSKPADVIDDSGYFCCYERPDDETESPKEEE